MHIRAYLLHFLDLIVFYLYRRLPPPSTTPHREQRIKRAFDCSAKKKFLPAENQPAFGEVMEFYVQKEMDMAKGDREERAILNSY